MFVFVISGRRQAGKSTFFKYASELLLTPPKEIAYVAEPLKDRVCIDILGCTTEQCYGTNLEKDTDSPVRWEDAGEWYRWAAHPDALQSLRVSVPPGVEITDVEDTLIRRFAVQDGGDNPGVFYMMKYRPESGYTVDAGRDLDGHLCLRPAGANGVYVFSPGGTLLRFDSAANRDGFQPPGVDFSRIVVALPLNPPLMTGKMSARKLMQYGGNICRNFFGQNVFVRPAMKRIAHEPNKEQVVLLTDARAIHELFIDPELTPDNVRFIRIRLLRAPYLNADLDTTETALDAVPNESFDFVLDNREIAMPSYRRAIAKILESSLGHEALTEEGIRLAKEWRSSDSALRQYDHAEPAWRRSPAPQRER